MQLRDLIRPNCPECHGPVSWVTQQAWLTHWEHSEPETARWTPTPWIVPPPDLWVCLGCDAAGFIGGVDLPLARPAPRE